MSGTRIFISHSSEDTQWCRSLVSMLEDAHYSVWCDFNSLRGGEQWLKTIQEQVGACDVFLLVLTPQAWNSSWVQEELQLAQSFHKTILPVLVRQTATSGFITGLQLVRVVGLDTQQATQIILKELGGAFSVQAETAVAMTNRGIALASAGKFDEALQIFSEVIRHNPNSDVALVNQGKALSELGRHQEGLAAIESALRLAPNSRRAMAAKAVVLPWLGRYQDALIEARKGLQTGQNNEWSHIALSVALNHLGQFQESLEAAQAAIAINAQNDSAWACQALAWLTLERLGDALQAAERTLAINQANMVAWVVKSQASLAMQREEDAQVAVQEALRINGRHGLARLAQAEYIRLARPNPGSARRNGESALPRLRSPSIRRG